MSTGATLHRFEIELADSDRGVYETLDLRVARHASESARYLIVRVLAFCLEHAPGIAFSPGGVSSGSEPALAVHAPTGERLVWIEVGQPSPERLHRAAKATERVALYTDRRLDVLRASLRGGTIHRARHIRVTRFPRELLERLEERLERRVRWHVAVHDGHLYVTVGAEAFDAALHPVPLIED